jgi:hypothetical protein
MKTVPVFFLALCLAGCRYYYPAIHSIIDIRVTDSSGTNLLNPANPQSIPHENIKVYYVDKEGELHRQYDAFWIFSSGLESENDSDAVYFIRIALNYAASWNETETVIEWNGADTDTIRAVWKKNLEQYEEVYINEQRMEGFPYVFVK